MGEILARAGMVLKATVGARRAGAAQIEAEYGKAQAQEMGRGFPQIKAVLAAGETVDQHHQGLSAKNRGGQTERSDQAIAAAVPHRQEEPLCGVIVEFGAPSDEKISQRLEIAIQPWRSREESRKFRPRNGLRRRSI